MSKLTGLVFVFCFLVSAFAHMWYHDNDHHYYRQGYVGSYDYLPTYRYGGYRGYRGYGGYPSYRRYGGYYPGRRYRRLRRYRRRRYH